MRRELRKKWKAHAKESSKAFEEWERRDFEGPAPQTKPFPEELKDLR